MKISFNSSTLYFIILSTSTPIAAQSGACVKGVFDLNFEDTCNYESFKSAFQPIFDDLKDASCSHSIDTEISLLTTGDANGDGAAGIRAACTDAHITLSQVNTIKLDDIPYGGNEFVKTYYDGGTFWNEETETLQFPSDGDTSTHVLKEDAARVDVYYDLSEMQPFQWPGDLSNFDPSTCELKSAMCCWPQDRQANDNNGNCDDPYDTECVDKDPADNTDLCMVDMSYAPESSKVKSSGFTLFEGDDEEGEGPIHCHGFAWSNDDQDFTSRYKANNLFYVSMYDHMYKRGYVRNIPGAPMCGCTEQMPIVSRSDCTQTNIEEEYHFEKNADSPSFTATLTKTHLEYQSCQGKNNKNNDLEAYYARLVDEGKLTSAQQDVFKKYVVGNNNCDDSIKSYLETKGYTAGYENDQARWTYVVGKGGLASPSEYMLDAIKFKEMVAATPNQIVRRVCTTCESTHRDIYYRRLTPMPAGFNLLDNLMNNWFKKDNEFNIDFALYSDYYDAVTDDISKRWQECNFDDQGIGFPRDCGPTKLHGCQWNSYRHGGCDAEDHAFYIETIPSFTSSTTNIAQGRPTQQSSTEWVMNPSRAVDGNTVGVWDWMTTAETRAEPSPWWSVWLEGTGTINQVYIFNRADCCWKRLSDVKIEVLDGKFGGNVVATRNIGGEVGSMGVVDFGGVSGQTVRVSMPSSDNKRLNMAEVQVIGNIDANLHKDNVAFGKPTYQSSEGWPNAERAVDGNTSGEWNKHETLTHTEWEQNPWWMVDLQGDYKIDSVEIFNREDCCEERLTDPLVEVLKDGVIVASQPYSGMVPKGGSATFTFPGQTVTGDAVRVRIEDEWGTVLTLAEVIVLGNLVQADNLDYSLVNAAFEKSTSQSSIDSGGESSRAVDGNSDGNWNSGTLSRTSKEPNPWWSVDLGEALEVMYVRLFNRFDCCADELTNPIVELLKDGAVVATEKIQGEVREGNSDWEQWNSVSFAGAIGDTVRVRLEGTERMLVLAEVEVFAKWDASRNIAYGKPASQSSLGWMGDADHAVDGNTDGRAWNGSVSETENDTNPWWMVDLEGDFPIQTVFLYNRVDCCSERIEGVIVDILKDGDVVSSKPYGGYNVRDKAVLAIGFNGVVGDSVRVRLPGTEHLSLAEVEVISA